MEQGWFRGLSGKVLAVQAVILLLFAGLTWQLDQGVRSLRAQASTLNRVNQVRLKLGSMLGHVSQAQAEQRAYLVGGHLSDLAACQSSLFAVDTELRAARRLAEGLELLPRLDALDPLLVDQVKQLSQAPRPGRGPVKPSSRTGETEPNAGLALLRERVSGLMGEQTAMMEAENSAAERRFNILRWLLGGSSLALLLLMGVIHAFVQGEMGRRHQVENQLNSQKGILQLVLDHMGDAVLVVDLQGKVILANPAAKRFFGPEIAYGDVHQWANMGGLYATDESTPLDLELLPLARALRGEEAGDTEVFLRTERLPQGLHLGLAARPLRDSRDQLAGALMVCRDISAQRSRVLALRRSNDELQASLGRLERDTEQIGQLSHLVEALQAGQSVEELGAVCGAMLPHIFEGLSGCVMLLNPSRTTLKKLAAFGGHPSLADQVGPQDCWALRRGQPHRVGGQSTALNCAHLEAHRPYESLCQPLAAGGELLGLFYLVAEEPGQLEGQRPRLALAVAEQLALALANLNVRDRLKNQSILDPLTGLYNRRYMEESFEREKARSADLGLSISLVMSDVDHFKQFNDRFGHDAGDVVLKEIARTLRAALRPTDIVCRFGGEELVVLLPGAGLEQALRRADLCRQAVEQLKLNVGGRDLGQVTISMGVASDPGDAVGLEHLVKQADLALYHAKSTGRNRVISARSLRPSQAA